MARIKVPKTEEEVKKTSAPQLRQDYNTLAHDMNKILDGKIYYCHCCDDFHDSNGFYSDKRYASGLFPECKKNLLLQATDYDKKTNTYTDNRDKTIEVFRKLNLPFIDSVYKSALNSTAAEMGEKNRQTAYQHMLTIIKSLPQYKNMDFSQSEFDEQYLINDEEETKIVQKTIKAAKKRFGTGFSNEDYMYLENTYQDWCTRTQVDSLSQETYVKQICMQLLDIDKDRKDGKDVSKKLDALDKLMNSANLQPKQNVSNAATDSLTFGQLIEKWEQEKPIPDPDPEFADVNSIGKFLRVYFSGHLSRALGLKNAYSQEYEEEIAKYTVTKPEISEEGSSSEIYDYLFGNDNGN